MLPEVPTTTELGISDLVGGSWQGLFFPKDTPTAILDRLFAATQKAMADRDLQQRLASGGAEVVVSTSPAEYARYVARETQKWEKVVKESGITAD